MADIEQMTDEERVQWVLDTPRSERPERGHLPKLGFWKRAALSMRLSDHLRQEVIDGFLTQEEALEAEIARIGRMPDEERVEYVLSTPSYERPKKGPLEGETASFLSEIFNEINTELTTDVQNGYLTLEEAKTVAAERKEEERVAAERKAELDPTILHVVSPGFELKVYPGYLQWNTRLPTWGKFNTLPFSRIQKIERRRSKGLLMPGIFARDLCIVATDSTEIELSHISKEHAELVTQTIYRVMGGDHTKVGKIDIWDK